MSVSLRRKKIVALPLVFFFDFRVENRWISREHKYHTGIIPFSFILALHCQLRRKCRNIHVCQPCWPEIYQWEGDPRISQGFGKTLYKRRLFKSDFTTRPTVVISIMNALVSLNTLVCKILIGDFKSTCSHRRYLFIFCNIFKMLLGILKAIRSIETRYYYTRFLESTTSNFLSTFKLR